MLMASCKSHAHELAMTTPLMPHFAPSVTRKIARNALYGMLMLPCNS